MKDVWEPIAGTRFFTRNGTGLYERLTPHLYLRLDELDESDRVECCRRIADGCLDETAHVSKQAY
jgi:hypothetical protein